ncbi:MAG: tetratricopeptide repeat protein [Candidatus Dojkabacteria bacterium]|nr:MAG: tetratricopeptide repeat protein [Candidatus Dojkabacteria bacterium]
MEEKFQEGEISKISLKDNEVSAQEQKNKKGSKNMPGKPKNKKWLTLLMVVTGILLLVLVGLIGYRFFARSSSKDKYEALMLEAAGQHDDQEYSLALATYNEALALDPTFPSAYIGVLNILLEKNLADDAEEFVAGAEEIIGGGDMAELYLLMADYYYDAKAWDKAYAYYAKVGNLEGESIDRFAIASVNSQEEDWKSLTSQVSDEKLQTVLQQYSDISTQSDTDLYDRAKLAQLAINAKAYYFAVNLLKDDQDLPDYWDGLYYVGRAYYELGEYERAADYLDQAVQIAPEDPALQLLAARNSVQDGNRDLAFSHYDQYISYSKGDGADQAVLIEYIELLIEAERYSKALEVISEQETSTDELELLKLQVYIAQKDSSEVIQLLDRMESTVAPGSDSYYMYIWLAALWYIEEGQFTKAEGLLSPVEEATAQDPYYFYVMGRLVDAKGDEKGADEYFKLAVEKDLEGEVSKLALNYIQ